MFFAVWVIPYPPNIYCNKNRVMDFLFANKFVLAILNYIMYLDI